MASAKVLGELLQERIRRHGLRAARDAVVAEFGDHYGWAPGPAFTPAELGGLQSLPLVSADEIPACLGVRTLHYRAIASGQPVAIVAVFRAWPASLSGTTSAVAQRLRAGGKRRAARADLARGVPAAGDG